MVSDNPLSPQNPINRSHIQSHVQTPGQPPLKRRRIVPHNDPLPVRPPFYNSHTQGNSFSLQAHPAPTFTFPVAPAPTPATSSAPLATSSDFSTSRPHATPKNVSLHAPSSTHASAPTTLQESEVCDEHIPTVSKEPQRVSSDKFLDRSKKVTGVPIVKSLPADQTRHKVRKRRYALFLAYCGENYHGMQINPGVLTIEQLIMSALHEAQLISDAEHMHPSNINLMRSARTDKGVSSATQCVSFRIGETYELRTDRAAVIRRINNHLPDDIRAFCLLRCTMGFNARSDCNKRRYEYIFPLRLLGGSNAPQKDPESSDSLDPRLAKLSAILRGYEGSHCFANFTEGPLGSEDALRRHMISVKCVTSMLPPDSGVYYVIVEILGQSFLLHQIRKMVGLALVVYHGHLPQESLRVALLSEIRFPTPKAPAEGLLLDKLYFEQYNKRFVGTLESPIGDNSFEELREKFKVQHIYKRIAEKERYNRVLETWVKTSHQRLSMKPEEIMQLHQNFISSTKGRDEMRRAHIASLYPILTDIPSFMDSSSQADLCIANNLLAQFERRFNSKATFVARSPGRVILIGEHLDYNGLPVIGAALKQGTFIAGCQDPTTEIFVEHLEQDAYAGSQISIDGKLSPAVTMTRDQCDHRWLNYVSWGVKSLSDGVKTKRTVPGGGRALFSGNLPRAGGLASSSSLVSASVLMAVRMGRRRLPREELALMAVRGEREGTNTRGGSVDHVISMCAAKDHVVKVSFLPKLSLENIKWPKGARLFVVDSHVKAEKGISEVKKLFSLRAAECRIGAAVCARRLEILQWHTVTSPGQLLFQALKTDKLKCTTISKLIELLDEVVPLHEVLSLDDVRKELGVDDIELERRFLCSVTAPKFKVGLRIAHVMREAKRVEDFAEALKNTDSEVSEILAKIGEIMNDGHHSLQNLFESSVPEVDRIVNCCRNAGALGSRMTGAGWGGYVVNLVKNDSVDNFVDQISSVVGKESVIEVLPWSGACILAIHQNNDDLGNAPSSARNVPSLS